MRNPVYSLKPLLTGGFFIPITLRIFTQIKAIALVLLFRIIIN